MANQFIRPYGQTAQPSGVTPSATPSAGTTGRFIKPFSQAPQAFRTPRPVQREEPVQVSQPRRRGLISPIPERDIQRPSIFEKAKSLFGRVAKQAGNLIDDVFRKKGEFVSPIPEREIVEPKVREARRKRIEPKFKSEFKPKIFTPKQITITISENDRRISDLLGDPEKNKERITTLKKENKGLIELATNNSLKGIFKQISRGRELRERRTEAQIKAAGAGAIGTTGSFLNLVSWQAETRGKPELAEKVRTAEAKVQEWAKRIRPENPTFANRLAEGIGSTAPFYLIGSGITTVAKGLALVSPKLALLFGASAAGAVEAGTEAGSVYEENKEQGKSVEEADEKASNTFLANVAFNIITNKFGPFSDDARDSLSRILKSAGAESLQEMFQQIVSNLNTGKDPIAGVVESGVLGGIIGGGLGQFTPTGKSVELTPESVQSTVIGSDLENTDLGKVMIKASFEAQEQGKNVSLTQVDEGIEGEGIALSPEGNNISVDVVEPTEKADSLEVAEEVEVEKVEKLAPGIESIEDVPLTKEARKLSFDEFKEKFGFYFEGDTSQNYYRGTIEEFYKDAREAEAEKPEVKIEQANKELQESFKSADPEALGRAWSEAMAELEVAQPGKRLFNEEGEFTGAIKSTFPDWVPEELRTTKLFNSVLDGLKDPTKIVYPPNSQPKKQALYDEFIFRIDSETGLDSFGIIERIKEAQGAKEKITEKPIPSRVERGKEPIAKAPEKAPPKQVVLPDGRKESKVISRVKDTLRSELSLDETLYTPLTLDNIAKKAVDIVNKDPKLASDIINGTGVVPEDTTEAAVLISAAEAARKRGKWKLQKDLILQRSFMQTRHGQEIVTERLVTDLSSDRFIRDVLAVRMDKIAKAKKGESKAKVVHEKLQRAGTSANKKVTKIALTKIQSAQQIIDSITC